MQTEQLKEVIKFTEKNVALVQKNITDCNSERELLHIVSYPLFEILTKRGSYEDTTKILNTLTELMY